MLRSARKATGLAVVLAVALAGSALAAVSFGAEKTVPQNYSWNYSNSLEYTGTPGTAGFRLHTVVVSDNSLPQAAYYTKSANGASWIAQTKLSGAGHVEGSSVATAGSTVLVGWMTQKEYPIDNAQPRKAQVRISSDAGANWGGTTTLSPGTGRVDYPIVAAAITSTDATNLYIVWTDSNTGKVRFRMKNGANAWTPAITLGTTTSDADDGYGNFGYANVGATGDLVTVAWIADNLGTIKTRSINLDGDATAAATLTNWEATVSLTGVTPPSSNGYPIVGASPLDTTRTAVGWNTATQVKVTTFDGTTTGTAGTVVYTQAAPYNGTNTAYAVAPEPAAGGDMVVAWSACRATNAANDCNYDSPSARVDMVVATSSGGAFSAPTIVSQGAVGAQMNDSPSLAYDGTKIYVMYNKWKSNYGYYDVFTKVGTGSL